MKTIFISGASRGIGLELCRQILERGDDVIAGCRNPKEANDLTNLAEKHTSLQILQLDVDNEASVEECFKQLWKKKEKIDQLFNNAGVIDWCDLLTVSTHAFSQVLTTNLLGAYLVLKYALPF